MGKKFIENLVSIVTPVYNGEKYINRLLESVLKQTWQQIEMIVSDDGSTDHTINVVESYRIRFEEKGYSLVVVTEKHRNASAAVSEGLQKVRGEYLIWPDGDDELVSDSVEKRVRFLKEHAIYQCVRSTAKYVNFTTGQETKPQEQVGRVDSRNLFWDILFGKTYVCCGCYMLKSKTFFEIYPDGRIPIYNVGQNFQMLLPFMYKYECPTIDEALYVVNRREDSHSARLLSEQEERAKYMEYEQMLDDLSQVIGIKDRKELQRIDLWKMRRRLYIAKKYADKKLMRRTAIALFQDGDSSLVQMCGRIVKSFLG